MTNPEILQHYIKSETDEHCIIEWDDVLKAMEVAAIESKIDAYLFVNDRCDVSFWPEVHDLELQRNNLLTK